ncbi:MAG: hypothetical protein Q4A32_07255 [Lachnospiraceae bacterium]|nr:hypothetical protein [Lachnospiraceae bacterium]
MNMKKPEMKIMRFVNEDVIATSGATPAPFTLMGFFDGQSNNLRTVVDGIECEGEDALNTAFKNKFGGGDYNMIMLEFLGPSGSSGYGFNLSDFQKGSYVDNIPDEFLIGLNGDYSHKQSSGSTITFTPIKTQ